MAMTIRFKFKGRCEKHPRFNPARQGLSAVRAGCETCQQLYRIWAYVEHAQACATYFDGERGGAPALSRLTRGLLGG